MNILFILLLIILVVLLACLIGLYSSSIKDYALTKYSRYFGGDPFSIGDLISTKDNFTYGSIKMQLKSYIEGLTISEQNQLGIGIDYRDKCLNNLGLIVYEIIPDGHNPAIENYNCFLLYPKIFDEYKKQLSMQRQFKRSTEELTIAPTPTASKTTLPPFMTNNYDTMSNEQIVESYKQTDISKFSIILDELQYGDDEEQNLINNQMYDEKLEQLIIALDEKYKGVSGRSSIQDDIDNISLFADIYIVPLIHFLLVEIGLMLYIANKIRAIKLVIIDDGLIIDDVLIYKYIELLIDKINEINIERINIQRYLTSQSYDFYDSYHFEKKYKISGIESLLPFGNCDNIRLKLYNIVDTIIYLVFILLMDGINKTIYNDDDNHYTELCNIIDLLYSRFYLSKKILVDDGKFRGERVQSQGILNRYFYDLYEWSAKPLSDIVERYRKGAIDTIEKTFTEQKFLVPLLSKCHDIDTQRKKDIYDKLLKYIEKIKDLYNSIRFLSRLHKSSYYHTDIKGIFSGSDYLIPDILKFIKKECIAESLSQLTDENQNYIDDTLKAIKSSAIVEMQSKVRDIGKQAKSIREKLELKEYLKQFPLDNSKIFRTTISSDNAIGWTPMSIKPIANAFGDIFINNFRQSSLIFQNAHGGESDNPPIELMPNEYVLMNCNPWISAISKFQYVTLLFNQTLLNQGDSNSFRELIYKIIGDLKTYSRDELLKNDASDYLCVKNNFCLFQKKCPDIMLENFNSYGMTPNPMGRPRFNGSNADSYTNQIPKPIIQYPVVYKSNTIEELVTKIESSLDEDNSDKTIFSNPNNNTSAEPDEQQKKYNLIKNQRINNSDNLLRLVYNMDETDRNHPGFTFSTFESSPDMLLAYKKLQIITKYLDTSDEITTYKKYINPNTSRTSSLKAAIEELRVHFPNGFLLFTDNCRN
jgi:hypothetical protein